MSHLWRGAKSLTPRRYDKVAVLQAPRHDSRRRIIMADNDLNERYCLLVGVDDPYRGLSLALGLRRPGKLNEWFLLYFDLSDDRFAKTHCIRWVVDSDLHDVGSCRGVCLVGILA